MAAGVRKQAKKIKFELTFSTIAGVGVVFFCILLWMFLLGVWAGESLLRSSKIATVDTGTTVMFKKAD
jgi:hypothetical protein